LREDLKLMRERDLERLALPFPGHYYNPPRRNNFRLGAAFFWAGYPEQALVYLNEVIREQPDNGKAHLAIGHIHLEASREGPAREHLERAVQLLPESADAWNNLGSLEMTAKNFREALRDFEKALALNREDPFRRRTPISERHRSRQQGCRRRQPARPAAGAAKPSG
jgi:tetratricopeptide (TPR) repeat protein